MALVASYMFPDVLFLFPFILQCFCISSVISSLNYWLFNNVLYPFLMFINFQYLLFLLSFTFIQLWSEKPHCMIWILLGILRFVLWPSIWSSLENFSGAMEKNVILLSLGVLYMALLVHSGFPSLLLLVDLLPSCSIFMKGRVLKSSVCWIFISPRSSVSFYLMYFS